MSRSARLVVPGCPHHITQRGNRRQRTFFSRRDYEKYSQIMADSCLAHGLQVWAYCLMPNHVHLIAVPGNEESLRCAIGEAHQSYTRIINFREDWQGHLWQGRFASYAMDEAHLLAATRYIELNPVRSGLVKSPYDWIFSSANAHRKGERDALVDPKAMLERIENWHEFLTSDPVASLAPQIRLHERTGRPLGGDDFIKDLERQTGLTLQPRKPGPKDNSEESVLP